MVWIIGSLVFVILVISGCLLKAERGRLLQPSTWEMTKMMGWRRVLNLTALHGYIYGRWTNRYLNVVIHQVLPRLGPWGKKRLAEGYHGKILTLDQARAIITVKKSIDIRKLSEHILPFSIACELVVNGPPEVAAIECGCRNAREQHCTPTQVCLAIGKAFVDFAIQHNPEITRRLTQEEAVALLRAEHERGHFHSAWFRQACLGRFYAICNCCKCCCCGVENMTQYGIQNVVSSGYVAVVDAEKCEGCGACVRACPFDALSLSGGQASVAWEKCLGCGVCSGQCPGGAVELVKDEQKGKPLDINKMLRETTSSETLPQPN